MSLGLGFFRRPTLQVCEELLGKNLVVRTPKKVERLVIFEVEAYDGFDDKASHASKGKTERNKVMFEEGGHIYMYLIYGVYWMLNLVTATKNYPSAVLVRGAGGYDGPGKLTKNLGIDGSFYGKVLGRRTGLWVEDVGVRVPASDIKKTPRIGVNYAQEWSSMPHRFVWRRP